MKIKSLIAVALVAIVGAFAAGPAAASTSTKVTIKGHEGDYYGYVKSSDSNCEANREVKVYKMLGSKPKPKQDQQIGSDTSAPNGPHSMWSIGNSGYKHGAFYAKVSKTDFCGGAKSKVIYR